MNYLAAMNVDSTFGKIYDLPFFQENQSKNVTESMILHLDITKRLQNYLAKLVKNARSHSSVELHYDESISSSVSTAKSENDFVIGQIITLSEASNLAKSKLKEAETALILADEADARFTKLLFDPPSD